MTTRKLLGSNRIRARAALVSAALLIAGWLVAPRARQTPLTPPQERAAPLIEQQTAARDSALRFEGVQQVRDRIRDQIVAVVDESERAVQTLRDYQQPPASSMTAAGFGVVVAASGEILTHEAAIGARETVRIHAGPGPGTARVVAYEPETGLVLLRAEGLAGASASAFSATTAEPGSLVVAASRLDGRDSIAPAFVTDVSPRGYAIAPVGEALRPGTPVYNTRGELLAVATSAGTALPAAAATERLMSRAAAGRGLPASLGIVFQPMDASLSSQFGASGALVSDVIDGGPADLAGVAPGDLVVGVGETIVESPETAHSVIVTLALDAPVALKVQRGDRPISIDVRPVSALAMASLSDVPVPPTTTWPRAGELFPEEVLRPASISASAAVISVNLKPVASLAQTRRELNRARGPVVLYLQNADGQRFFAVVNRSS